MLERFGNLKARLSGPAALAWALAIGLFVQVSGYVWFESGSARNAQVYLWLLLPALVYGAWQVVGRRSVRIPVEYWPWLGMLAWMALSTLWASGGDDDPGSLAKRGLYIALFLMAVKMLHDRNTDLLRKALLVGVAVAAVGALATIVYQFFWLERPIAYRAYRLYRLGIGDFADYGWPVVAGIFHGSLAIWALGVAFDRRTPLWRAAGWFFIFAVLSLYVLLTYTRGAWIGVLAAALAVVLLQRSRRAWVMSALGLVILGALMVVFWDRLLYEVQSRQLSGRGAIWDYFFEVMPGHWLVGHGLGTPFEYKWPRGNIVSPHAHSLYLQQVYDSGLVALALMGAGLLMVVAKVWQLRDDPWVRLAFPVLVFALIAMLTDVERIFNRPGVYWTVFWLPLAILLARPIKSIGKKTDVE